MKKMVFKLETHDEKTEHKARKAVSGINPISMDMKDHKLTVIGDMDPVAVAEKLSKFCPTKILLVGPSREPEKEVEEPKMEEKEVSDYRVVFRLDIYDDKGKRKTMKAASCVPGIESISIDMKDRILKVTGRSMDVVSIVTKLRKICMAEIISVGRFREPGKEEWPKKNEEKEVPEYVMAYIAYNPHMTMTK